MNNKKDSNIQITIKVKRRKINENLIRIIKNYVKKSSTDRENRDTIHVVKPI